MTKKQDPDKPGRTTPKAEPEEEIFEFDPTDITSFDMMERRRLQRYCDAEFTDIVLYMEQQTGGVGRHRTACAEDCPIDHVHETGCDDDCEDDHIPPRIIEKLINGEGDRVFLDDVYAEMIHIIRLRDNPEASRDDLDSKSIADLLGMIRAPKAVSPTSGTPPKTTKQLTSSNSTTEG